MRGAYLVEATIDSGAAASVRPPHIFEEYERFPAEDQYFVAANGDLVPELYQVRPVIATQEGLTRFWSQQLRFAIGATGSSLINRGDGLTLKMAPLETMMFLEQKEGVYVQKFAVILARNVGFRDRHHS